MSQVGGLLVRIHAIRPLLSMGPALPRDPAPAPIADLSPRSVYRWAIGHGWTEAEAGNWAAWCAGLPIVDGEELPEHPWTVRSVEHLSFLRWLAGTGQLAGDTLKENP